MIETVRLLPHQSTIVQVTVDGSTDKIKGNEMFLLEQDEAVEEITGLHVGDILLYPNGEGQAHLVVSNQSGLTQVTPPGAVLGEATAANLVPAFTKQDELEITPKREVKVKMVDSRTEAEVATTCGDIGSSYQITKGNTNGISNRAP